jgi:hypothetical protein
MSDLPDQDEPKPDGEDGGSQVEPGLGASVEAASFEDVAAGDGYTTGEFHNVVQKQIVNAVYETLVETKLHWELVEPFLDAARQVCRGDFRRTARIELHGTAEGEEGWTDAEEAYLSLSVADQDDGREWLSETWWLSDLVLAGSDPERVREAARALERTVGRLDAWLAEQEKGPDESGS